VTPAQPPAGRSAATAAPAGPPWRWLSPRSLVVRPVTDLIRLLPVLVGVLFFGTARGAGGYLGVALAGLAIVTSVVRYCTTRYQVTAERVYLRHGLLTQKVLSVPRDRIRTVDLSAHLVYRLLGLRRVEVGTGLNDRHDSGVRLDALTRTDAETLRAALLAIPHPAPVPPAPLPAPAMPGTAMPGSALAATGMPGAAMPGAAMPGSALPGAGPPAAANHAAWPAPAWPAAAGQAALPTAGPDRELARLAPGWVRFAPLTLTGLVIAGVVLGTAMQVVDATHVDVIAAGPVRHLIVALGTLTLAERAAGVAVAVLIALTLLSVAGYIALFWNFRLVSQGTGTLRISRGLLSTRTTTIDTRRLRGAELSEPLLLRAAGGARCLAITTGLRVGHGAERGGSLLLPPAPRQVAGTVAAAVLQTVPPAPPDPSAWSAPPVLQAAPEPPVPSVPATPAPRPLTVPLLELVTGDLVRHGPAARRRRYIRAVGGAAVIAIAAAAAWAAGILPAGAALGSLVLLPLAAALAADRYRSLGHRLAGGWLVIRTGSLIRRRSVLSVDGVIGWRIRQTWFQRRQGLVSLSATTAAGRGEYIAHDIPVSLALALATAATADLLGPFRTRADD
jgi:putative membrane protein